MSFKIVFQAFTQLKNVFVESAANSLLYVKDRFNDGGAFLDTRL